jgi:hypothetical protein
LGYPLNFRELPVIRDREEKLRDIQKVVRKLLGEIF